MEKKVSFGLNNFTHKHNKKDFGDKERILLPSGSVKEYTADIDTALRKSKLNNHRGIPLIRI